MAIKDSAFFCAAVVMHKRLQPKINQFVYRIFYLCFEISKISDLSSKFLSLNRFNLFSFYNRDHGKRDGSSLESWIREILAQRNINHHIEKIYLLTHPRVFGYVFNPVSFWFCLDSKQQLIAVLAEVNNTFGENHNYLIHNSDQSPIQENQWLSANKEFHVSPFFKVEGSYKFRFIFNKKTVAAWIDYFPHDQQKNLLTSVVCNKIELSDKQLLKGFYTIPLATLKVIVLIHWQALKIITKKIKYVSKPAAKSHKITFNHD